jgi:hypothetical protein
MATSILTLSFPYKQERWLVRRFAGAVVALGGDGLACGLLLAGHQREAVAVGVFE